MSQPHTGLFLKFPPNRFRSLVYLGYCPSHCHEDIALKFIMKGSDHLLQRFSTTVKKHTSMLWMVHRCSQNRIWRRASSLKAEETMAQLLLCLPPFQSSRSQAVGRHTIGPWQTGVCTVNRRWRISCTHITTSAKPHIGTQNPGSLQKQQRCTLPQRLQQIPKVAQQ